ncbi:MAG: TAXI family TRAP transporter solute-binding subunit [Myxococcota bacterium]
MRDSIRRLVLMLPWVLLLGSIPQRAFADTPTYRWGAGSKTGGFTRISKAVAEGLEHTGEKISIDIHNTKGSCDNIHRLLQGQLDFALVQYDVAAEAFKASEAAHHALDEGESDEVALEKAGGFMCKVSAEDAHGSHLRLISAMTDGAVHVLVRRPLRLDSFTDLSKHRLFMGKDGSGSFETAKVLVGAAGLTPEELQLQQSGSSAAFKALRSGDLRVMLRTTEPGHEIIAQVVGSGVATVNPLPDEVLDRLIDGYPYYRVCQIEADTYPGLDYAVPTVCVTTVLLTSLPPDDRAEEIDFAVNALLDAVHWVEQHPDHNALGIQHRWRDFAEQEPIPLHRVSEQRERDEIRSRWLRNLAMAIGLGLLVFFVRRLLKRRGLLKDPLEANLEGQLSNPLIPFAGFVTIVMLATFLVWTIEHDSNARVRTLNDSFWEMNMFATGNFDTEALKSSTARFIGAMATIAGLGSLAWFTAALTNIFSRDQTRIFRRLRNHIVILNFREDMLQLIRMLRSPGPTRSRPIHVVVSDTLPRRVRLQLARVKGLTIYHQNPEVPEDLAGLRIPRAARVIVLKSPDHEEQGPRYHPLRIARAVHQACSKFEHHGSQLGPELGKTGFSVAPPLQHPALAGDDVGKEHSLPVTLAEATDEDPEEIFDPFRRWLIPVQGRELADSWMATASVDPGFAEIFNGAVSFRDDNSEVYTVPLPEWFHGETWRTVRRTVYGLESRAGIIPLGLYRATNAVHAYDAEALEGSSPQGELQKRLLVNPGLDLEIEPGDRLVAFAEDEADLVRVMRASKRT